MTLWRCVCGIGMALALASPRAEGGQTQGGTGETKIGDVKPDVIFKHTEGKPKIYDLDLNHGQKFVVRIDQTCLGAFDYSYTSVARGIRNQRDEPAAKKPLEHKDFTLVYDQQFGGYVFNITQKPGADPSKECEGGDELIPLTFIVSVRQEKWNLSFSGAFTISGLTDPVFSVKTENAVKKVIEEKEKQDERRLGAASFVHLFHDRVQWNQLQPALGFGLGINSDNHAEYMVGAALRFGDKATINVGRAWGSITRLPNGVNFDTPITDDNVLNNLGARTVSRWFVAISYAFIDTKDRLVKPFAPDTEKAATEAQPQGDKPLTDDQKKALAAIIKAATHPATYDAIAEIKGVVNPAGGPARTFCDPDGKPVELTLKLTVKVKGADEAQLKALNSKSTDAMNEIAKAAKKALGSDPSITLTEVKFASCQ